MTSPRLAFFKLAILTGLAGLLGCGSTTKPCNPGTVLVTVTFDAKTKGADSIDVNVRIDGGAPKLTNLPHKAGDTQGSVEVFFPNGSGYPAGKRVDVSVVARSGQMALGTAMTTIAMAPSGCGAVSVKFGGSTPDGGAGADGAAGSGTAGSGGGGAGGGAAGDDGGVAGQAGDDGGAAGQGGAGGADASGAAGQGGAGGAAGAGGQPACVEAATRPCSAGGVLGKCANGTETCTGAKWGACSIAPAAADVCDTKGDDSNCNGTTNDGCPCVTGDVRVCGDAGAKGNCAKGAQTCTNGKWDACTVQPATSDSCATKGDDSNCNGIANEGCACIVGDPARSCGAGGAKGNCAKGTQACNAGVWGACSVAPAGADSCAVKGDDANCNGTPNDGCPCVTGDTQSCGPAAVGICKPGTQTCTAGVWGACLGAVNKAARDCTSAADNDCDGKPDNTIDLVCKCAAGGTQACGAHPGNDGKGPCHAGSQACVVAADKTSSDWGVCTGAVGPAATDTCAAGNDDNCSGTVNDGCVCVNGVTKKACGFCGDGSQTCTDGKNGIYTACSGGTPGQSFTALALNGTWTNAPFSTTSAAAALDCSGIVQLKGAVSTTGSDSLVMTLPAQLRPSSQLFIPVDLFGGDKGRVDISPSGAVTVDVFGGDFSRAQGFLSLEGVTYAVGASGFTAVALANGWTNAPFATRNVAVANVGGIVHFEGAINNAGGVNAPPFTLPIGFRPPTDTYVPVDMCSAAIGRMYIQPSGLVTIQPAGLDSTATCFTSFEGAWFALSASGFTALPLTNGWTNAPFATRNVAVSNAGGIVRFQGAISTTATSNSSPFTLPVGFRPATNVYLPIELCDAGKGRLYIPPSGTVTVIDDGGGFVNAPCFTSFEGASFGL
jgi:hypothetical protein